MATEMVKRIARTISDELRMPGEFFRTDDELEAAAQKVLAAMRQATEAHIVAWERQGGVYRLRGRPDLAVIWRRMIDAALAD